MEDQTFSSDDRLRKRREFEHLAKTGRKVANRHFVALYLARPIQGSRLGVTVSRKVGGAVVRNRLKRLIRVFFRLNRRLLVHSCDLNIIARASSAGLPADQTFSALEDLFKKIAGDHPSKPY